MKCKIIGILCLILLTSGIVFGEDNAKQVGVYLDNEKIEGVQAAVLVNDTTLVQLRLLSERLGYEIQWSEEDNSVILEKGDLRIELWVGQSDAVINGRPFQLSGAPLLISDYTMVPVRFTAELLGKTVQWGEKCGMVFIDSPEMFRSCEAEAAANEREQTQKLLHKGNEAYEQGLYYETRTFAEQVIASGIEEYAREAEELLSRTQTKIEEYEAALNAEMYRKLLEAERLYQAGMYYEARSAAENIYNSASGELQEKTSNLLEKADLAIADYEWTVMYNVTAVYYVSLPNINGRVNLRSAPSLNAEIISAIPHGGAVGWIHEKDEFTRVEYNGLYGYIKSEYLSASKPDLQPVKTPDDAKRYAINYYGGGVEAVGINGPFYTDEWYYYEVELWSRYSARYMTTVRVWQNGSCETMAAR